MWLFSYFFSFFPFKGRFTASHLISYTCHRDTLRRPWKTMDPSKSSKRANVCRLGVWLHVWGYSKAQREHATASPADPGLLVARLHKQPVFNYRERILSLIVVEEISLFAGYRACSFSSEMSRNRNQNIKKQGQITKQLISSAVLVKSYVGFSVMEKSPFPRARLELFGHPLENHVSWGHLEHHACKH